MTTFRQLSRPLRAAIVASYVLALALVATAATPGFRTLLLDANNHPTTTVDFASSHWTGDPTSGKAINPASTGATTPSTGAFTSLFVSGAFASDAGDINSDGLGNMNVESSLYVAGPFSTGPFVYDFQAGGSDGSGGLFVTSLTSSGNLTVSDSLGIWGAAPPTSQAATPTDLPGVIAILQAYGFCQ